MLDELKKAFPGRPQITVQEAARYLHKDRRTLLADPKFPYRKCNGRYLISLVSLARWMGGD